MNNKSSENKIRFTFDRRKLTIDPVPTIYYYKNINDATVKLNYYSNKNVVNLIPYLYVIGFGMVVILK